MSPFVFSIRPPYVDMFRDGTKQFEYRRRRPNVSAGDMALIYETAPVSAIVATARVGIVYEGKPFVVWNVTQPCGGIDRATFDKYFGERDRAVAIELEPTWLDEPVPLPAGMAAPQSWARYKGTWPPE
jgi:predicted transcriptional regulator